MISPRRDVVVAFDGSFDGFLCVVYAYYYEKVLPVVIQREDQVQLTLGEEIYLVETDESRAARVLKGLKKKVSEDAVHKVYYALLSGEDDKYMAIFRYVQLGFKVGHMIDSHLKEDCVREVHKLAGRVGKETHLLTGFCRFSETESGVFYCAITPKNDVLAMLAAHFCERFMNQQWIIHDKSRKKAAIYDGNEYIITDVPREAMFNYAEGEKETQNLWVVFFETLAIEARKNPKLHRNIMPLRYRGEMTEFKSSNK